MFIIVIINYYYLFELCKYKQNGRLAKIDILKSERQH